jgi:hypothetical protein
MSVTITSNMQLIDDANQTTGWTSSLGGLNTDTANPRESTINLQDQASEGTYEVFHTITLENYTARTIFGWQISGAPEDETNDGLGQYISDGTNDIAYSTGGNDNFGFTFLGWSSFRLNTADLPTNFRTLAGDEGNLDVTSLTQIGYCGNFPGKAAGNADNVKFDVIRYMVNTTKALDIAGGTTGARGTWAEVTTEDESTANAWGIIRLMLDGSKAYQVQFGLEIGNDAGPDSYFEDADFQLYLNGFIPDTGAGISAGSMDFDFVASDTAATNVCNFDNFFIQSITVPSNWDANAPWDELQWTNGQFVDLGTLAFPPQDAGNRFLTNVVFVNCGQVSPNTLDMDGITYNGSSDATGAMLLTEDQDTTSNMTDITFISDGSGYGIRIAPTGAGPFTYNFDDWQNSGYGADDTADAFIRIAPVTNDADITINLLNGAGTVTVDDTSPYTGTLTINNSQPLQVTGVTEGAAVKMIANETVGTITTGDVIFELLADENGEVNTTINYEAAFDPSGLDVIIRARQQGLANFAISQDDTVHVDETTNSNSSSPDDMSLLVDNSPVIGEDSYYFGHAEQFGRLKLDVSTARVGTAIVAWRYWDGGGWVLLSDVVDGTNNYSNTGENTISWTIPGDWAKTSVDGNGPAYYIRPVYAGGTITTPPRGRKCKLDVTRYLPFVQDNTITSTGLSTVASWSKDAIAQF